MFYPMPGHHVERDHAESVLDNLPEESLFFSVGHL